MLVQKDAFKKTPWWPSYRRAFKYILNLEWLKIPIWKGIFTFLKLSTCSHFYNMKYHMKRTSSTVKTQIRSSIFGHNFIFRFFFSFKINSHRILCQWRLDARTQNGHAHRLSTLSLSEHWDKNTVNSLK